MKKPVTVAGDGEQVDLLQALLHPNDAQKLRERGQDPASHTSLALDATRVQVSERLPGGGYQLNVIVVIPPGIFKEKSRLILPGGAGGNALDDALGALPSVNLPVRIDRLSEATAEGMRVQAAAMLGQTAVDEA